MILRLKRLSSLDDEFSRLGRWRLFQQDSAAALPMTLERAAVVYGPRSSGGRTPESELETDAECVVFGAAVDESVESRGDGDDLQEGSTLQVGMEAEGVSEKARFGMRQQFMGFPDGNGAGGAEGLFCFEGRAPPEW